MAPKNKAKAAGVSTSSFFDLKAELAKQEEEFAKNKAAGKATAVVGGVKRPDKKPTVWARQNTGVKARAARDIELEEISRPTLESARAVLERKALVYEKLRKGKSGGLSDKQYEALLVDFDQKAMDHYESDSDDVDESLTVPRREGQEDDPIIEYEDEFGRLRSGRRSEIPRHLLQQEEAQTEKDDDPYVIYNPVNHFPVYEPSEDRVAAIESAFAEENNPLNVHYDASGEVRAKGAGFYQFSADEEMRRRQMEELRAAREETDRTRQETGAADAQPGEVEGMSGGAGEASEPAGVVKSRAMEKRKRELEERRKMLDAKRRKVAGGGSAAPKAEAPPAAAENAAMKPKATEAIASADPFAALEAQQSRPSAKHKVKGKAGTDPMNAADAFLAQLEQEVLKGAKE